MPVGTATSPHAWLRAGNTPSRLNSAFTMAADNARSFDEGVGRCGAVITARRIDIQRVGGTGPMPPLPLLVVTHHIPQTVPPGNPSSTFVTEQIRSAADGPVYLSRRHPTARSGLRQGSGHPSPRGRRLARRQSFSAAKRTPGTPIRSNPTPGTGRHEVSAPEVLTEGIMSGESPRQHYGQAWFCDWAANQVIALKPGGSHQVAVTVPSLRMWLDFLPARRLYVNPIGFDFPGGECTPGLVVLVTPAGTAGQVGAPGWVPDPTPAPRHNRPGMPTRRACHARRGPGQAGVARERPCGYW
jgi:hypothetical protein